MAREFEILHGGNPLLVDSAFQITAQMRIQLLVGHTYIDG